jgi:hypothetical protein
MEYPKVTEKILNCSLGEETSAFEAYWDQQEQLAPLELRRDDSPPQRSAYRVLESVGRQKAFKHPRATVEFVRDQKRTRFRMLINRHWAGAQGGNYFQLDPNWLVLIRSEERVPVAEETEEFSGSECYVPFPEEVLEAVPAEFETFLHGRGITMENGKPTQPKLLESIPPTPAEPEPIEHGYSLEGKTMPNRAIFCLNTSAYNFAQWLERHTSVKEFPSKSLSINNFGVFMYNVPAQ